MTTLGTEFVGCGDPWEPHRLQFARWFAAHRVFPAAAK
jgi:hypothetical protein